MKKERDYLKQREATMIMAFVTLVMGLLLLVTLLICVPIINKSEKAKAKEATTTVTLVSPATVYEPRVVGKNVYIQVDGSVTGSDAVNLRSNPNMSDKYKVGKLESGTKFIVNEYYAEDEFIGFPVEAVQGIVNINDEDGIVWMSGYYLHVGAFDYPELASNPDGLAIIDVSSDYKTITIAGGDPNVRSTPSTQSNENVYGQIKAGTVLHPTKIVTNDTYTFYGVKLDEIKDFVDVVGFGNMEYDQDGILWISSAYAQLGY